MSAERKALAWAAECKMHRQPLDLFCKDDHIPLCVECNHSQEHGGHSVVPVEEAAQDYRDQITSYLEILQKEKAKNMAHTVDMKNKKQFALKEMEYQRQAVKDGFNELYVYLRDKHDQLGEMDLLGEEILDKGKLHKARLSEEFTSLGRIIREMEEKCQQPARELLQDVRRTLQSFSILSFGFSNSTCHGEQDVLWPARYEERKSLETPGPCPVELIWKFFEYSDKSLFFKSAIKQFKDTLIKESVLQKANITLDPDTAHPLLILSEDQRSVRLGDKCQDVPNNPERFKERAIVLGREGFTAGRHSWEVTVENAEKWAVGIARKSVQRKAYFNIRLEEGVWAMERGEYGALDHPNPPMSAELKRIRVVLNYPAQKMAIYDVDRATVIYTVSDASFSGEPLVPFFFLGGTGHLTLSS